MRSTFFILLAFITLLAGCTDAPNEVGRNLLLAKDTLHLETRAFAPTADSTIMVRVADNAGRLLVGLHDGIEAASVLQFTSVPKYAAPLVVDSALLILRREYAYIDSSTPFGIRAYKVERTTWASSTFTWDTLAGFYTDSVGSTVVNSVVGDTAVRIRLDTSIIHFWATNGYGMLVLRPIPNVLGMNMVLGFGNTLTTAQDFRPELHIFYHDSSDTVITTYLRSPLGISVANGTLPAHPGTMLLQSGIATRGLLHFDSLGLPPKVSITSASIALPVDPALTLLNGQSRDSVIVYMPRQNVFPYDSLVFATVCNPHAGDTLFAGQKYYSADVTNIVQYWLVKKYNWGFEIHTYGQYSTLDRISLYGTTSTGFRPRLTISYTVLP